MSTERTAKLSKLVRGPGGRWLCRCGCGREVERQKSHKAILEAKKLGWDYPVDVVNSFYHRSEHPIVTAHREAGFPGISRSWWEMDHIVEVVRGGGCCGLDNLQTLCVPCHRAKTRRLRAELAAKRRLAVHPDLLESDP